MISMMKPLAKTFMATTLAALLSLFAITAIAFGETIVVDGATALKLGEYTLRLDGRTQAVIDTTARTISIGPVKPGPNPPPDPDPVVPDRPSGFAGVVFDRAIGVGRPDVCEMIAGVYATVVKDIDDSKLKDRPSVGQAIQSGLSKLNYDAAQWASFSDWLGDRFNEQAKDMTSTREMVHAVNVGLSAAGKAK